jgi:hypothetical protein
MKNAQTIMDAIGEIESAVMLLADAECTCLDGDAPVLAIRELDEACYHARNAIEHLRDEMRKRIDAQ